MADKTQGQTVITALIIPLSSASPPPRPHPQPPGGGGQPPRPDNTLPGDLPRPEHPIWYPLPPGVPVDPEWGIPEDGPHPDQGLPGEQPHPDQGLPGSQPRPDQGLPGPQPHPEHPIVLPPGGGNWKPIYIWGQPHPDQGLPGDPRPDQGLPPIEPPKPDEEQNVEWVTAWTPETGWVTVGIVVPEGPVPTPSRQGQGQRRK